MFFLSLVGINFALNGTIERSMGIEWSKAARSCHSEACYKASQAILENMDLTADPCEDFYQFACGNYMAVISFLPSVFGIK